MIAEREFRVMLASETAGVGIPESAEVRSVPYADDALRVQL